MDQRPASNFATVHGSLRALLARYLETIDSQFDIESILPTRTVFDPWKPWMTRADWDDALNRAYEISGDPVVGARVGAFLTVRQLGAVGRLIAAQGTVGDALARWCRYESKRVGGETLETVEETRSTTYRWRTPKWTDSPWVETCAVSMVIQIMRDLTGLRDERPKKVTLTAASSSAAVKLRHFFSCPVEAGGTTTAVAVDRRVLSKKVRAEVLNSCTLEQYVTSDFIRSDSADPRLEERIRCHVAQNIGCDELKIGVVAGFLGITARTLQRRLRALDTSYLSLRHDTRLRLADGFLRDRGFSIADVSELLGYTEHSAFSRAFRAWTGHPAQVVRRELLHDCA